MNTTQVTQSTESSTFWTRRNLGALLLAACLVTVTAKVTYWSLQPNPKSFVHRMMDSIRANREDLKRAHLARIMSGVSTTSKWVAVVLAGFFIASFSKGSSSGSQTPGSSSAQPGPTATLIPVVFGPVPKKSDAIPSPKDPSIAAANEDVQPSSATNQGSAKLTNHAKADRKAFNRKHFVIDGTNVCRSYRLDNQFHLESLLNLATELLGRELSFECYFDASTKYQALRNGSATQRDAYLKLVSGYPVLFREVPAGESADHTVLMRANSESCAVISNDRFKKEEDGHLGKYPWLAAEGRLIRGRQYEHQLVVERLGIDVPVTLDLDSAIRAFEATVASSRHGGSTELPLAA